MRAAAGSGHRFHPSILREYDVRGVVGETLHEADAAALGRAYATMLRRQGGASVAVGYDGRLSSPNLEAALVEALIEGGIEVWRIGLGPTPMLYFAVHEWGAGGGIMVTGSHNPPNHNGFKMMLGKVSLHGEAVRELGRIAAAGAFVSGPRGRAIERPLADRYVARLARDYLAADNVEGRPLAVAWDAGNGAAGAVLGALTALLPGRHILLNDKVDGLFPAHHPDPSEPRNLLQLQAAVRAEGCDLGIAFDGDGDRIGVVDGNGDILWGDQLLVILAREVLARWPGAAIVGDVKASRVLYEEIARAGGRPVMWKSGHSLIKAKMLEEQAPLAGELSGHIFYADGFYGFDDALYAAVRLLRILSRSPESLAEMSAALSRTVASPEYRFDCPEERKFAAVAEVAARLKAEGARVVAIDGVRVESDDGWWLLRASNTQAALSARCEAADAPALKRLKAALARQLRLSGLTPPAEL